MPKKPKRKDSKKSFLASRVIDASKPREKKPFDALSTRRQAMKVDSKSRKAINPKRCGLLEAVLEVSKLPK